VRHGRYKAIAAAYALLVQLSLPARLPAQADSDGAMFRADLRHSGVYRAEGVRRLHGIRWKFKTGPVVEAWFSSPTVAGGVVYAVGCLISSTFGYVHVR